MKLINKAVKTAPPVLKVIYLKNKHELDLRSIYQIEQECYEAIDLNDINKTKFLLINSFK